MKVAYIIGGTLIAVALMFTGHHPKPQKSIKKQEVCLVEQYPAGLLYFRCAGEAFVIASSTYLSKHPELRVTAVAGDNRKSGYSGTNYAYLVFTERR
ncbi:MAG: hypothetical protein AAB615_02775 [Patescibacteria group bacterium]